MTDHLEGVRKADAEVGLCGAKMAGALMVWKDDPLIPADIRAHMTILFIEDSAARANRDAAMTIAYAKIGARK